VARPRAGLAAVAFVPWLTLHVIVSAHVPGLPEHHPAPPCSTHEPAPDGLGIRIDVRVGLGQQPSRKCPPSSSPPPSSPPTPVPSPVPSTVPPPVSVVSPAPVPSPALTPTLSPAPARPAPHRPASSRPAPSRGRSILFLPGRGAFAPVVSIPVLAVVVLIPCAVAAVTRFRKPR
jgi:hypothetical protein